MESHAGRMPTRRNSERFELTLQVAAQLLRGAAGPVSDLAIDVQGQVDGALGPTVRGHAELAVWPR